MAPKLGGRGGGVGYGLSGRATNKITFFGDFPNLNTNIETALYKSMDYL